MQSHVNAGRNIDDIPVRLHPGGTFTILTFGLVEIYADSPADCDEIIKAAAEAKSLLLGAAGTDAS